MLGLNRLIQELPALSAAVSSQSITVSAEPAHFSCQAYNEVLV